MLSRHRPVCASIQDVSCGSTLAETRGLSARNSRIRTAPRSAGCRASVRTPVRTLLARQLLSLALATLVALQTATAQASEPLEVDCCQCEEQVNEMLSSMYGWVWGSDSQYCRKDFPDVSSAPAQQPTAHMLQPAASTLTAAAWQVWAGFVDSFTDTLKARGATAPPSPVQVCCE